MGRDSLVYGLSLDTIKLHLILSGRYIIRIGVLLNLTSSRFNGRVINNAYCVLTK